VNGRILLALLAAAVAWSASASAADWQPVPGNLMTPWAEKVDPKNPLPEYPRPQLVRAQWQNLNGLWDYAIVDLDAPQPTKFDGKILVPFCVESALSGVKKPVTAKERLWYRRTFAAPDLAGGKRLLLHFGAVDWEAVVSVNGKEQGKHRGGYDPFTFDITDAVKPGDNELVVRVWDSSGANGEPKGKQHYPAIENPGGIMYTPCTGIWQTVWLETVPAASIASLKLVPDVDAGVLRVKVAGRGATDGMMVELIALDGEKEVSKTAGKVGSPIELKVPSAKLWSPDSPFLYNLKVSLRKGDAAVDAVESYFGMRKIALGKDDKGVLRPMLNGQFVFQAGPLDQGFWPDGIYTAPTDEALRFDIEATRKLGMNMARKHVKIEPARWYYWCDKLGLLVWQDMPSGGGGRGGKGGEDGVPASPERAAQFEAELKAMVESFHNHPSIIMWVVFNEGWGQYDTVRLTKWVKELDPTRLTNNASGWTDRKTGDVHDIHAYPGPGAPPVEEARAIVLGEFGGLGLGLENHKWVDKSWGYRGMPDAPTLNRRYLELWMKVRQLCDEKGLSAAVYTQTTDVETECNGLLTYDRRVFKIDAALSSAAILRNEFPPAPEYKTVVPIAPDEAVNWRYTVEKPADGWFKPDFDDSAWKQGPAGFGTQNTPGTTVRTEWKTDNIWVRRDFTLPDGKLGNLMLRIHHDEDAEVFLNGVPAAKLGGHTTQYEEAAISPAALKTLRPGKNTIAIHCRQTMGGQYIDAGLVEEK
jgi:hypothetical protein